ncbi:hypothetical protein V6N13_144565 [Hibiscus sabdariffa]
MFFSKDKGFDFRVDGVFSSPISFLSAFSHVLSIINGFSAKKRRLIHGCKKKLSPFHHYHVGSPTINRAKKQANKIDDCSNMNNSSLELVDCSQCCNFQHQIHPFGRPVCWDLPPSGTIKFSVDGAPTFAKTSCGGTL